MPVPARERERGKDLRTRHREGKEGGGWGVEEDVNGWHCRSTCCGAREGSLRDGIRAKSVKRLYQREREVVGSPRWRRGQGDGRRPEPCGAAAW
jgi:hypothetical protein